MRMSDWSSDVCSSDLMVEQLLRHSLIDIAMSVKGDLHIDQHHTVEDSALALGEAIARALGDKRGIARYGEAHAPMDETLTRCTLDLSGRLHRVWKSGFSQPRLGEVDHEVVPHRFADF